ncbi:hypothetical protein [Methylobacterium frigidaeris]|uniref:Uncharacterized protein n=1 Tax=Methylobacterium frigidaeris TaxID=2038277 RepID=A0AA37M3X5_9HYPH|nr:hypothetical protein [Methylobacterium frigidaeris]PIK74603.1 hypothetical protein CS379_01600 [Methylobacterium frigidaeris]GJD61808.1 hypothetical protein MPEAHAMD_1955 [Methylobacterium frigidaeris]
MRSLLLAGAVLAAFSTSSADAWTQSLLHPEGQGTAVVTTMPTPPRYSGYDDAARRAATRRVPPAPTGVTAPTRPSDPPAWPSCPWC